MKKLDNFSIFLLFFSIFQQKLTKVNAVQNLMWKNFSSLLNKTILDLRKVKMNQNIDNFVSDEEEEVRFFAARETGDIDE